MSVPLVHPDRIDWAGLAARVRPPVGLPERVAVAGPHIAIRTCCDPAECTCGGVSTWVCICGRRHLPRTIENAPWRTRPRPAWSTRPWAYRPKEHTP